MLTNLLVPTIALTALSNHRLSYNIRLVFCVLSHLYGRIRKLSYWKQDVYSVSEVRNRSVFYQTGGIHKSKYFCYIAQPSMLCHNYVKFWQIRRPKLLHVHWLCVQWTQEKWHNFTWLILPANLDFSKICRFKNIYFCVLILRKALMFMVRYSRATIVLFFENSL